ncbi:MAG: hypothetical protein KF861_19945 [Planctomycetaceae bacterium]|nr:hypothetical protein [Planctomycetaceae bacterium]
MDARALAVTALLVAVCPAIAVSATHRTKNFVVTADSAEFAKQAGEAAEYYRHHLAISWLGKPLPGDWSQPCPIHCKTGRIGAGGATSFTFNNGEVFGWKMDIQGSEERILDSVLPHEISHMIFACHFRRPLPRWADEGAATLVEHESERLRQTKLLDQVIKTSKRIPLRQLLTIKEYPRDMQDVLTLYAEGYSLADYLVQKRGEQGRAAFLAFLGDALDKGWQHAFETHYGMGSLDAVEHEWTEWVYAGSPILPSPDGPLVAGNDVKADSPDSANRMQVRGQSPETFVAAAKTDPLPKLSRPLRERTQAAHLAAPPPGTPSDTNVAAPSWEGIPTEPISVHPARPASAPDPKPKWQFPWQKSTDPEGSRSDRSIGFSNTPSGPATRQSAFDFSR